MRNVSEKVRESVWCRIVGSRSKICLSKFLRGSLFVGFCLSQATGTVSADATLIAWGENTFGQFGNGSISGSTTPVDVLKVFGAKDIAAGSIHTLMLKSDGTVWAWGSNFYGQLGVISPPTKKLTPVQVLDPGDPTGVLTGVKAIAARDNASLALKNDGTVWAWGSGSTPNDSPTPVLVSGLTEVKAIAFNLALKNDGTVWKWSGSVVTQVSGLTEMIAIAAGDFHSLAVKSDGTVWAWGSNFVGQLGDGTTTNRSVPVQVSGITGVTAIAAGSQHSLAVKSDGTVWAWGFNNSGELGNGTTSNSSTPVRVSGVGSINTVTAGTRHSLAIGSGGAVWTWGLNDSGQLGNGSTNNSLTPVLLAELSQVRNIAAGTYHSLTLSEKFYLADFCSHRWWHCADSRIFEGFVIPECSLRGCVVITPLLKMCLAASNCPRCPAEGSCPPFYHIFLDGLQDAWDVGLFDAEGKEVRHEKFKTPSGLIISFRPSKESYIDGRVGDYLMAFRMNEKGKPGVEYKIAPRLQMSDRPYKAKGYEQGNSFIIFWSWVSTYLRAGR